MTFSFFLNNISSPPINLTILFVNTEQILTVFDFGWKNPERWGKKHKKCCYYIKNTVFYCCNLPGFFSRIERKENGLLSVFCKNCCKKKLSGMLKLLCRNNLYRNVNRATFANYMLQVTSYKIRANI